MHIEVGTTLHRVGSVIAEKIKDAARGYSSADKARVTRIIKDPSSISPEDIERYKQNRLDSLIPLGGIGINFVSSILVNLEPFYREVERQSQLNLEQLADEVWLDAQRKAQKWKLKPTA